MQNIVGLLFLMASPTATTSTASGSERDTSIGESSLAIGACGWISSVPEELAIATEGDCVSSDPRVAGIVGGMRVGIGESDLQAFGDSVTIEFITVDKVEHVGQPISPLEYAFPVSVCNSVQHSVWNVWPQCRSTVSSPSEAWQMLHLTMAPLVTESAVTMGRRCAAISRLHKNSEDISCSAQCQGSGRPLTITAKQSSERIDRPLMRKA